jgi:peptidyl-tRNA hydrolase, PTH2 family
MNFKQVIIVRRDISMGTGKVAAQVAHAAVIGAEKVKTQRTEWFNSWFFAGQAKVVLKVKTLQELTDVSNRAAELNLPVVQVQDSGLTQIPSGTITCIGIGPAPSQLVDRVTADLKLL